MRRLPREALPQRYGVRELMIHRMCLFRTQGARQSGCAPVLRGRNETQQAGAAPASPGEDASTRAEEHVLSWPYGEQERRERALCRYDNLKNCSCWMCGNPRRYEGKATLQERRLLEAARDEAETG